MSELGFPPIAEIIRRRFQSDQQNPTIGEQLQPCVVLENDRPEYAYLSGDRLWSAPLRVEQAAAANQFICCQLLNPTGSKVMAVLTRAALVHSCGVAAFGPSEYHVGIRSTSLTNLNLVGGARDLRWNLPGTFNARSICQIRHVINAASQLDLPLARMINVFGAQLATSCQFGAEYNTPIVIPPGTGIAMETVLQTASRNDFQFTWEWRERAMSSWEVASPGGT